MKDLCVLGIHVLPVVTPCRCVSRRFEETWYLRLQGLRLQEEWTPQPLRADVPRFVQTSGNARRHGVTSLQKLILIAFVRVL